MLERTNYLKSRNSVIWVLVIILLLSASLVGCNDDQGNLTWSTDVYYQFHTRDAARAQDEVPFTIIFPTYLPANITTYPEITGPLKGKWKEDRLEVSVDYLAAGEFVNGIISIEEYNYPVNLGDPALNPGLSYLEIAGTKAIESTSSINIYGGTYVLQGWIFGWDKDNIYFIVRIYGYDRDTTVKIIQSMIE